MSTKLTPALNFQWRDGCHAFHWLMPNGAILSCIWTPARRRGNYPHDLAAFNSFDWTSFGEVGSPGHKTLDEVLAVIREQAGDSVELAAFWPDRRRGWLHPDEWDGDVMGWQSADDVQRFVEWACSPPSVGPAGGGK